MVEVDIDITGANTIANLVVDACGCTITNHGGTGTGSSSAAAAVSVTSAISNFFHHRAGVIACPWYDGNGPCTVQIRMAMPDMFDVGGLSDASFNEYRKTAFDGFVGAYGNVNLGNEVAMSQSIYRGDASNSTYNFLCVYPSAACAAYYWLAATGQVGAYKGMESGSIFASLLGFRSEFNPAHTVSGDTWILNPGYDENSVNQNYFLFTGLTGPQQDYFKNTIGLTGNKGWSAYGVCEPSYNLFRYSTAAGMTSDNTPVNGFFRPEVSISGTIENIDIYNTVNPYNSIPQVSQAYASATQLADLSFGLTFPDALAYLPPTAVEFAALKVLL